MRWFDVLCACTVGVGALLFAMSWIVPEHFPRPALAVGCDDCQATPTPLPILPRVSLGGVAAGELPAPLPTIGPLPEPANWPGAPGTVYAAALTQDQMIDVLRAAGWPEDVIPQALAVAWCESQWQPEPGGYNDNGTALGMFQLWGPDVGWPVGDTSEGAGPEPDGWWSFADVEMALWREPLVNACVARVAWEYAGWSPWSCKP